MSKFPWPTVKLRVNQLKFDPMFVGLNHVKSGKSSKEIRFSHVLTQFFVTSPILSGLANLVFLGADDLQTNPGAAADEGDADPDARGRGWCFHQKWTVYFVEKYHDNLDDSRGTPYDLGNLLLCLKIGVEHMAIKLPYMAICRENDDDRS